MYIYIYIHISKTSQNGANQRVFPRNKSFTFKIHLLSFQNSNQKDVSIIFIERMRKILTSHKPSGTLEFDLKGNRSNNFSQISHIQQKSTRPLTHPTSHPK